MQTKIPCVIMRGGTSRGPFFKLTDLPSDVPTRDAVLLSVMARRTRSRWTASAARTR